MKLEKIIKMKQGNTMQVRTKTGTFLQQCYQYALLVTGLLLCSYLQAAPGITSDKAKPHYSSFASEETFEDMRIKVLGGDVRMTRRWTGSQWVWNSRWHDLAVDKQQSLYLAQLAWVQTGTGDQAKNPSARIRANTPGIIYRAGQVYRRISQGGGQAQYENQLRNFITMTNTGFSWRDSSGNSIDYDYYGRMVSYADKNNVRVYLERDSDGYVTEIKDHHNNTVLYYTWESIPGAEPGVNLHGGSLYPKRLTSLRDHTGRTVTYQWDSNNHLVQITDVLGSNWQLVYSSTGQLTKIIDPLERATTYDIDLDGRFNSRINADGVGSSYTYGFNKENQEYYIQEKHTSGKISESWFNGMGIPVRESTNGEQQFSQSVMLSDNSLGVAAFMRCYSSYAIYWYKGSTLVSIDWIIGGPGGNLSMGINDPNKPEGSGDSSGNAPGDIPVCGSTPLFIKQEVTTNAWGAKTTLQYDQWRNVISRTNADGSRIQTTWNHQLGLPLRETDEGGVITTYEYDNRGNLLTLTEATNTDDQRVTRYTYDLYGQLLTMTTGESAANNTALATTTYAYDDYGNLIRETDPMGGVTTYTHYDALGNAHIITDARANAENGDWHWTKNYDAAGNLLSDLDPYGEGNIHIYNAAGDKIQTSEYGVVTRITSNTSGLPLTLTDTADQVTRLSYNHHNLPTRVTDAMGHSNSFSYNSQGLLAGMTDGEGNTTHYHYQHNQLRMTQYPAFNEEHIYDNRGRLARSVQQANNRSYTRRTTYDAQGQLTRATDANNHSESYTYDRLGRLTRITDASGAITTLAYDAHDNLVQVTDPEGSITRYGYDLNDNTISETLAGGTRHYQYDAGNNLTRYTNPQGETIVYSYDQANRLTRATTYANSTGNQPVKVVNYSYSRNQLSGYNQTPGAHATPDTLALNESYSFNNLGQLTNANVNLGRFSKQYSYTYYPNGLTKTYTNPEGITYTYYYNKNNQLAAVHIPNHGQLIYSNFAWLVPQTLLLPGGTTITLKYNDFLDVVERIVKDPADNSLDWANYQYDMESNITLMQTRLGNYQFGYDNLYRLNSANYPDTIAANDETFAYDNVGNRTSHTQTEEDQNTNTTLTYNQHNQLTQATTESGTTTFTYNANGHTKTKTENGIVTEYIYNRDERLTQVKVNGQVIADYAYNPYGQRIRKIANGRTTYYLYNDNGLAAEYDSTGTLIKEYHFHPQKTWMTDPLFQRTADNQIYYYQNDHLGTPQRMLTYAGATVWQATYSAFGEASVSTSSTAENNLRFPGQYFDEETNLHQNFHRDYDTKFGRYIQSDPIGLRGGINTYTYGFENPIYFTDSLGLSPDDRCSETPSCHDNCMKDRYGKGDIGSPYYWADNLDLLAPIGAAFSTIGSLSEGSLVSRARRQAWGGHFEKANHTASLRKWRTVVQYRIFSWVTAPVGAMATGFKYGGIAYCHWECRG